MPTTLSLLEFVNRWRGATLKERSAAQSHFNHMCGLVGHPTPTEYDAHGTSFVFEAGADKTSGGRCRAQAADADESVQRATDMAGDLPSDGDLSVRAQAAG